MGFLNVQDKMLDFGTIALSSASGGATSGYLSNTLNIGEADVNQFAVGFDYEVPLTGTSITAIVFSIEGSDNVNFSSPTEIASIPGNLTKPTFLAIPRGTKFKYLKAKVKSTTATAITAGTVHAAIDTYVGK